MYIYHRNKNENVKYMIKHFNDKVIKLFYTNNYERNSKRNIKL